MNQSDTEFSELTLTRLKCGRVTMVGHWYNRLALKAPLYLSGYAHLPAPPPREQDSRVSSERVYCIALIPLTFSTFPVIEANKFISFLFKGASTRWSIGRRQIEWVMSKSNPPLRWSCRVVLTIVHCVDWPDKCAIKYLLDFLWLYCCAKH